MLNAAARRLTLSTLATSTRRTAMTQALVLERKDVLNLREIDIDEPFTPNDVRIDIQHVGICGSDVHYYQHGEIGPFKMQEPMVLGHEAAGIVTEVGSAVKDRFKVGQRVCMEPGVPVSGSKEVYRGVYNLCPGLRFWATPPRKEATNLTADKAWKAGHGTLRKSVVHPAAFTFPIPDNVSLEWGAMVEPLSVGMHAATLAQIKPGDTAVIMGAGPIGMLAALSAVAGGCSKVYVFDLNKTKTKIAESLSKGKIVGMDVAPQDLAKTIKKETDGGADVIFECAGSTKAAEATFDLARPGGRILLVGCPPKDPVLNMAAVQMSELTVMGIFRYRNTYPQAIRLLASGAIDLTPIITDRFTFAESVDAFKYMTKPRDTTVKSIIKMPGAKN